MPNNRYSYKAKLTILLKLGIQGKANYGHCTVCNKNTFFIRNGVYDRDHYECLRCGSLPRHRIFMHTLNMFCKDWKSLKVHESSPGGSSSNAVANQCTDYSFSHYYLDKKMGEVIDNHHCQNLEEMTYADNTFDIFITQEVFEHIFNAEKAFKEIERVLKPGGFHVFTTPYRNWTPTIKRAELLNTGEINYMLPAEYHGNPIGDGKSLVIFDWGNDFVFLISKWCGMNTLIYEKESAKMGLKGELKEVFVSRKNFDIL